MSLVPAFEIGVWNAWFFMCVFLLQWLVVVLAGDKLLRRTGHPPGMEQTRADRQMGMAATIIWIVATLYSIFLPFYLGTIWFYVGLAFFLAGLAILIIATLNFARASADLPVMGGIYRYSRHPMYLSMFLIYLGVCLAAASWLFFLLTIVTIILQHHPMKLEEIYCLKRYGDTYQKYMNRTPRLIGLPKTQ